MPPDRRVLVYPLLAALGTSAAQVCIKTGRDALFFDRGGLGALAAVMLFTQLGQVGGSWLHLRAIQRFGLRRVCVALFLLATALFLGFAAGSAVPLARQALFLVFPIVFAALLSSAWLLAGDLLEGADRDTVRKSFARVGASATLGQIVGGLAARASSQVLEAGWLVGGGAVLLVAVAIVSALAHRAYPALTAARPTTEAPDAADRRELEGQPYLRHPYTRALFAIASVGALIGLFIEFQFYASVVASGSANPRFFASFYIVLAVVSLLLQLTVAPRVQARFGVGGALLVLPAGVLGTGGAAVALTTSLMQSVVRATESGLRGSIHGVTWEQVFLPYERGLRTTMKLLVDGVTSRLVVGAGAAALWVWGWLAGPEASYAFLGWVIVGCAAVWLGLTQLLRRTSCAADLGDHDPMIRLPDA